MQARVHKQRGGALVLVALAITCIIGMVGLAIDLNLALSASTDQQELSNSLATAAIEAYLGDSSADEDARLNSALQRALDIARLPQNRPLFRGFVVDPGAEPELCLKRSVTDTCPDSAHGVLIPGLYLVENNAVHSCPAGAPPCFLPGLPSGEQVTAFQVELQQPQSSAIRTIFAKLLGLKSLRTSAASTAAVVPRHIVFAIDLSPSIEGTTHNKSGGPSERRASAYKLHSSITCGADRRPHPDPCDPALFGGASQPADQRCLGIVSGTFGFDKYNVMWQNTEDVIPAAGRQPNTPYKPDYQCWHVDNDGNGPANYLIDLPNGRYNAQPLRSILDAIEQSLTAFRQRRNAGDRIQIQFFDTKVFDFREIPLLTAAPGPFAMASVDEADMNYQEIRAITGGDLDALITRHAIFPRVNPVDPVTNGGGVFTNASYSVWRALDALTRNTNVYARRNVVMFSDFMANCPGHEPNPICSNTFSRIQDALYHTWDIVSDHYVPNKIAFNPIVFGDYVRPHTTLPLDGRGEGCMWDQDQVRLTMPPPVLHGQGMTHSFVNIWTEWEKYAVFPPNPAASPPTYFAIPNLIYGAALDSQGEWGVIRPCCRRGPDNECADVRAPLDYGCRVMDSDLVQNTFESGWGCIRNPADPSHCAPGFAYKRNWAEDPDGGDSPYLDSSGHLICDPYGRTEDQQMQDYMNKILGSNSIVLVETQQRLVP